MICKSCGKTISDGSKFCTFCGTPVNAWQNTESTDAAKLQTPPEKTENVSAESAALKNEAPKAEFKEPEAAKPITVTEPISEPIKEAKPIEIEKAAEANTFAADYEGEKSEPKAETAQNQAAPNAEPTAQKAETAQSQAAQFNQASSVVQQRPYGQQPINPQNGQIPYNQQPYGQQQYRQEQYGQVPYGQVPYSNAPYGYGAPLQQAGRGANKPAKIIALLLLILSVGGFFLPAISVPTFGDFGLDYIYTTLGYAIFGGDFEFSSAAYVFYILNIPIAALLLILSAAIPNRGASRVLGIIAAVFSGFALCWAFAGTIAKASELSDRMNYFGGFAYNIGVSPCIAFLPIMTLVSFILQLIPGKKQ